LPAIAAVEAWAFDCHGHRAAISNGQAFENGRQFSAWLGLVPRQNSSGGKSRLLGITKRGDPT